MPDDDSVKVRIAELDDYKRTFELRWKADQRAIKRWQEANPGNDLVWPDHADLVIWLSERACSDAARIAELEAKLKSAYRTHGIGSHDG